MSYPLGTVTRPKPVVQVLRGYDPQETTTRMERVRVAAANQDVADPANWIRSGMIISKVWNGTDGVWEWVYGLASGATPYIALADARDKDVLAADRLPGLSCAGQFTIGSGYFAIGDIANYSDGVWLSAYANNDGTATNRGLVKVAGSGAVIVGRVVRLHASVEDMTNIDSSAADPRQVLFDTMYSGLTAP